YRRLVSTALDDPRLRSFPRLRVDCAGRRGSSRAEVALQFVSDGIGLCRPFVRAHGRAGKRRRRLARDSYRLDRRGPLSRTTRPVRALENAGMSESAAANGRGKTMSETAGAGSSRSP